MMEYTPHEVFRTLDDVDARAYIGLALASAGYYVQYLSNVRTGFRDRMHATPVVANMWNFADDLLYVAMFSRWFGSGPESHWFTKALWFGLIVWVALESITHYQTIKYSLADLFPSLPRSWALALYGGCQLSLMALFAFLVHSLADPIWLLMIATTQFTSIAFSIPMLIGRGSTRGISVLSARALLVAPAAFLCLFLPAVAPYFDRWPTYVLGAACFGIAAVYNVLLARCAREEHKGDAYVRSEQGARPRVLSPLGCP